MHGDGPNNCWGGGIAACQQQRHIGDPVLHHTRWDCGNGMGGQKAPLNGGDAAMSTMMNMAGLPGGTFEDRPDSQDTVRSALSTESYMVPCPPCLGLPAATGHHQSMHSPHMGVAGYDYSAMGGVSEAIGHQQHLSTYGCMDSMTTMAGSHLGMFKGFGQLGHGGMDEHHHRHVAMSRHHGVPAAQPPSYENSIDSRMCRMHIMQSYSIQHGLLPGHATASMMNPEPSLPAQPHRAAGAEHHYEQPSNYMPKARRSHIDGGKWAHGGAIENPMEEDERAQEEAVDDDSLSVGPGFKVGQTRAATIHVEDVSWGL